MLQHVLYKAVLVASEFAVWPTLCFKQVSVANIVLFCHIYSCFYTISRYDSV